MWTRPYAIKQTMKTSLRIYDIGRLFCGDLMKYLPVLKRDSIPEALSVTRRSPYLHTSQNKIHCLENAIDDLLEWSW